MQFLDAGSLSVASGSNDQAELPCVRHCFLFVHMLQFSSTDCFLHALCCHPLLPLRSGSWYEGPAGHHDRAG